MLKGLLQGFTDGDIHSVAELARSLDMGGALTLQIIEDLVHRGYLQSMDLCLDAPCATCPMIGICGVSGRLRVWALSEKGKKMVTYF